ncbi:MAG: metallophosphoesterase [Chlamydiae bacterium]|nr:metallophosphoesterase [Chlamydiota bacterium]
MKVWAISDLHLCFSVPDKTMEAFGWNNYSQRIMDNWLKNIKNEDLVLIPGDLCWAKRLEEALIDLKWIDNLPGQKVIIKGNHDYWWPSLTKLEAALPPSIHAIYNTSFTYQGITIGGARLWDTSEYNFNPYIQMQDNIFQKCHKEPMEESEKIFARELERLKLSLSKLDHTSNIRIALTHYPPIGADLKDSKASKILEEYKINYTVFGHLHSIKPNMKMFGIKNQISYIFTSADYINFDPVKILEC